jgi:hypothetical protein
MGLKETLQTVAQTAIKATGTIRKKVIYKEKTSGPTYVPGTGTVTENETSHTPYAILDQNISEDIPNLSIDSNEKLVYIAMKDLSPEPRINDEITIDSIDWKVIDVKTDPAEALWVLKIKRQ